MKEPGPKKPVERLFPFVLRSRILIVGRETLARSKGRLHFVLITSDLSEASRERILREFSHYPGVQRYNSDDLEKHFDINAAKVVGFQKSDLAQSVYAELKEYRINRPPAAGEKGLVTANTRPLTSPNDRTQSDVACGGSGLSRRESE
jgi:hypothetical protein